MVTWLTLIITFVGVMAAVFFHRRHSKWRKEDKDGQLRKETAPPEFYNLNGDRPPITIEAYIRGRDKDMWGFVTVVNPTSYLVKIHPRSLSFEDGDWPPHRMFFVKHPVGGEQLESITIMGNGKEDYQFHFIFPETHYPPDTIRPTKLRLSTDRGDVVLPLKPRIVAL